MLLDLRSLYESSVIPPPVPPTFSQSFNVEYRSIEVFDVEYRSEIFNVEYRSIEVFDVECRTTVFRVEYRALETFRLSTRK